MRFGQEWRPTNLGTLLRVALDKQQVQPKDLNGESQSKTEVLVREGSIQR